MTARVEHGPEAPTKLHIPKCVASRFGLVVAIDCEWDDGLTENNLLLSYQVVWVDTKTRLQGSTMYYPAPGHRPTVEELAGCWPLATGSGRCIGKVLVLAHNGLAEVAHMQRPLPPCQAVGKVPVTFGYWRVDRPFGPPGGKWTQWVQLRDTMLLAPEGAKALAAISATNTHYCKVDLDALVAQEAPDLAANLKVWGKKAVQCMAMVLAAAPKAFEVYGLFDSLATLEYYLNFQAAGEACGITAPSMTAVGMSQAAYIAAMPGYKDLWGVEEVVLPDEWGKRVRTRAKVSLGRGMSEDMATAAFKGGLNIALKVGHTKAKPGAEVIIDVDMKGAYGTAMASLKAVDWASARHTRSARSALEAAEAGFYVFAHVSYRFPQRVRALQTPLADKAGEAGLIYYLQGTCHCTGPELLAAHDMGAKLEVHRAVVYDTLPTYLFAEYIAARAQARAEAQAIGNKLGDLTEKLKVNGLFGKTGQGLGARKTSKVLDTDEIVPIRHSSLTSPQIASYITALIRCAGGQLMNVAPTIGGRCLSFTTDGGQFVVPRATVPEAFALLDGAYKATRFGARAVESAARLGQAKVLELKASGTSALVCRTRVNSLYAEDGTATNGAWTGWRGTTRDPQARAKEMTEVFARTTKSTRQFQSRLPTPFQVFAGGCEYRAIIRPITLRVDYDHKRRLLRDGSTETYATREDYLGRKTAAEALHKGFARVRKNKYTVGERAVYAATWQNLTHWPVGVPVPHPKSARAEGPRGKVVRPPKPRAAGTSTGNPGRAGRVVVGGGGRTGTRP